MFPANSRGAAGGECGQGGGARQRQQQQPALHQCTRDEGETGGVIVLHRHIGAENTWYAHKACVCKLVLNVFYLAILNSNCF